MKKFEVLYEYRKDKDSPISYETVTGTFQSKIPTKDELSDAILLNEKEKNRKGQVRFVSFGWSRI